MLFLFLSMMKLRSKEVNGLPKATQLRGSKGGTQPEPWALRLPRTSWSIAPGASPALRREPQEETERGPGSEHLLDLAAPPLGQAGCGQDLEDLLLGSPSCLPTGGLSQLPSAVCRFQAFRQTGT